jgi:hypothetical protein
MKTPDEEVQRKVREWLAYADEANSRGECNTDMKETSRVRFGHSEISIHPRRGHSAPIPARMLTSISIQEKGHDR